ncbi:MAG: lycopene cyclase domain-containing protein [Chloroflexota bacterium]|nr:lycopene cyclase domain-containing protein [Chloroflexota bacterium]
MYAYPIWLLFFLILPLMLVSVLKFQTLMKYKLVLVLVAIGCLGISVPWDILSVNDRIWYFSEPHIVGVWLLGLPIEEYLYILLLGLLSSGVTILLWERYGARE